MALRLLSRSSRLKVGIGTKIRLPRPQELRKSYLFCLAAFRRCSPEVIGSENYALVFKRRSSETVSFQRPCLRRRANILRPSLDSMRVRKPCLLLRFLREGWYVRFIAYSVKFVLSENGAQRYTLFFKIKASSVEFSENGFWGVPTSTIFVARRVFFPLYQDFHRVNSQSQA